MDEYLENLKLQAFSYLNKCEFLKKITHLVLSVYLITFFFPHSLPWHYFFHSFSYCFSTLPLRLITHAVDKNCMFILCNGILVLVVKNSGLISASKSCKSNEGKNSSELKPVTLDMKVSLPASDEAIAEVMDITSDEEAQVEDKFVDIAEESEVLISETCEEAENEIKGGDSFIENDARSEEDKEKDRDIVAEVEEVEVYEVNDDDAYGEDNCDENIGEENAGLSTDELNKKFDEFIRRMKEELRIEARQHLVMV